MPWLHSFPLVFLRNSVPQSPNFPVANASAHEAVLQRVTEMFKLNFPYTTVYPALGNLDVLHPRILEASESSSAFGKTREADHYGSGRSGHKKRRKWYGSNGREGSGKEMLPISQTQIDNRSFKHDITP